MLLPLLRRSCFPSSTPGGGGGGGSAERVEGARGPGARGRRPEREPYACMDPSAALHRRPAGGSLGAVSPALSGGQARRRKQPPRPADFKLQVIIIGSRGVGKTSLMERFTDDTFCEACKSTVGPQRIILRMPGHTRRGHIWHPSRAQPRSPWKPDPLLWPDRAFPWPFRGCRTPEAQTFPPGAFTSHEVRVMHPRKLPVRYSCSPRKTAL
eukprot:XP_006523951.1 PREDICTED: ras-related protein Rab-12 isoform X1 [Mus musculus]